MNSYSSCAGVSDYDQKHRQDSGTLIQQNPSARSGCVSENRSNLQSKRLFRFVEGRSDMIRSVYHRELLVLLSLLKRNLQFFLFPANFYF